MEITKEGLTHILRHRGQANHSHLNDFVFFYPDKVMVTDGYSLIIREVSNRSEDKFEPFCVEKKDVAKAVRENPGNDNRELRVRTLDMPDVALIGEKMVQTSNQQIPQWERVTKRWGKRKRGAKKARFNPQVIVQTLRGMQDCHPVELRVWGEEDAVRLDGKTSDGRRVVGFAMPIVENT